MGDISKHFSLHEVRCNCAECQELEVDPIVNMHLITLLEAIHSNYSSAYNALIRITPTSWNRCETHNRKVDGEKRSRHLTGKAVDIVVEMAKLNSFIKINPRAVGIFVDDLFPDCYGIGIYEDEGFTHIDIDERKWRSGFPKK